MHTATNFEIKAKITDPRHIRDLLKDFQAKFIGTDHQTDIYFKVPQGRLKLRKGNIENALIFYNREDIKEQKQSDVTFQKLPPDNSVADILGAALGILTIVEKTREIYFVDNVKFHIDNVTDLGHFVEIEAISENNQFPTQYLSEQCDYYMKALSIKEEDLVAESYSDSFIADLENETAEI